VVDPGGDAERIAGLIEARGIRVERILLTHGHLDHAGGAVALKARLERAAPGGSGAPPAPVPIEGPHEAEAGGRQADAAPGRGNEDGGRQRLLRNKKQE